MLVNALDWALGWILWLPRDLRLVAIALLTAAVLVIARRFSTNQDWLRRADDDKKRLRKLIREARRAKDKEAKKRYAATLNLIKLRSLKFEGMPLVWALVPVALLATWAFSRLAYVPPGSGEPVEVKLYVPTSGIAQNKLAHIVPIDGVEAGSGWIRNVEADSLPGPHNVWDKCNQGIVNYFGMAPRTEGVARWTLVPPPGQHRYDLTIIYDGRQYRHEVLVGSRHYCEPLLTTDALASQPLSANEQNTPAVQGVEVVTRPLKLFNWVGSIDLLFLPPWIVAYLLIAIPGVPLVKRLLRTY